MLQVSRNVGRLMQHADNFYRISMFKVKHGLRKFL